MVKFICHKDGSATVKGINGSLLLAKNGGILVKQNVLCERKLAEEIMETLERDSWAGTALTLSGRAEVWARYTLSRTMGTVEGVLRAMVENNYNIVACKQYKQGGQEVLMVQAWSSFEDDDESGGQFYFFLRVRNSFWQDISEAFNDVTDATWHRTAQEGEVFYRRSDKQ